MKIIKIILVVLALTVLTAISYGAYLLSERDIFGWRLNFSLDKVEMSEYQSFDPNISFLHASIFEVDLDTDNKYGPDYIAGIKLKTDERTGCDIRMGGPDLDFSKSNSELNSLTINPIKERAQDFNLINQGKIKVGGEEAYKVSFSFLDPIGARIRLDQIFTSNREKNFFIICGAGEYQYDFFKKDFEIFYNSIGFDGKISDFEKKNFLNKIIFWK